MGAVIPVDVVEALMGHEGKEELTEVYRRYSPEDLAGFYKEGEPAVLVFTQAGAVDERTRLLEAEDELLKAKLEKQDAEIETLKAKQERITEKLEHLIGALEKDEEFENNGKSAT